MILADAAREIIMQPSFIAFFILGAIASAVYKHIKQH